MLVLDEFGEQLVARLQQVVRVAASTSTLGRRKRRVCNRSTTAHDVTRYERSTITTVVCKRSPKSSAKTSDFRLETREDDADASVEADVVARIERRVAGSSVSMLWRDDEDDDCDDLSAIAFSRLVRPEPEVFERRVEERPEDELAPALVGVFERLLRALPAFGDDLRLEMAPPDVFFRRKPAISYNTCDTFPIYCACS